MTPRLRNARRFGGVPIWALALFVCLLQQGWAVAGMVACEHRHGEHAAAVTGHGEGCALHQPTGSDPVPPDSEAAHAHHACAACFAGAVAVSFPIDVAAAAPAIASFVTPERDPPFRAPSRLDRPPKFPLSF
jgi:hypothetical protein